MRVLPLLLLCLSPVLRAQPLTPPSAPPALAPAQAVAPPAQAQPGLLRERAIQRLHVEDKGAQIDELRYGGETQSITVTPAGNMAPYQIVPSDGARNFPGALGAAAGPAGQRVWKLLDF